MSIQFQILTKNCILNTHLYDCPSELLSFPLVVGCNWKNYNIHYTNRICFKIKNRMILISKLFNFSSYLHYKFIQKYLDATKRFKKILEYFTWIMWKEIFLKCLVLYVNLFDKSWRQNNVKANQNCSKEILQHNDILLTNTV